MSVLTNLQMNLQQAPKLTHFLVFCISISFSHLAYGQKLTWFGTSATIPAGISITADGSLVVGNTGIQ